MILQTKEYILDLIFPKFCVGCQKEGAWVCSECAQKVLIVGTQVCPVCGRISKYGKYCLRHQRPHGLSGIICACYFDEGPIKEAIHNFKYNHILELGNFLGEIMVKAVKENLDIGKNLLITAVPLHPLRRAQRGYNQAEILAETVADRLGLSKNFQILKKIRWTKPQVKVSGKKRTKNLKNCYKIFNKNVVRGKTIVLVDDVTTTGTTLNECAKVLRKAGAKRVWGLVIARG